MLVDEELPNTSFPGADIGKEFLQAFDPAVGEGGDALFAAVVDVDHLAVVDVVRVAGDLPDKFDVLADQRGDVADRVDILIGKMAVEFRSGFAAIVQINVAALCGPVARTEELAIGR